MQMLIFSDSSGFAEQLTPVLRELGLDNSATMRKLNDEIKGGEGIPAIAIVVYEKSSDDLSQVCRRLRMLYSDRTSILAVFCQGCPSKEIEQVLGAGADDYLLLPSTHEELKLRLHIAINRAGERAKNADVQQQLRTNIERFELAIQGANEGLWEAEHSRESWDLPEGKLWYSRRFKELLGFDEEEFPNVMQSWIARLHPEDHDRVMQAIIDHHEVDKPFDVEYRLKTKWGEYRWFSARGQAKRDEQGRVMRVAGSLRDIHRIKETEEKLRQSEARWRSLVENAPALIVLTTPEGIIQFVNLDTEGANASIGKSVYDYIEAPYHDLVRRTFEAVRETGQQQRYEVEAKTENGLAWYASRLGPVWHNDRIESIVAISLDVTRRKNAEKSVQEEREHLRQLLDLQERERRIVSYEIHDGMTQFLTAGIMHMESFAARIQMTDDAEQEYARAMSLLRESLSEARRLISGLRPPVLDELGIVAAIEYLVNEAREAIPQIEFINHVDFERLAAPLEVAIFRVTQEALTNIRKHSGSEKARVELQQHGRWVRLIIRDWGCGFDPAESHQERFGLQGIRQRARLLGTKAVVESAAGKGSTILIDFPLVPETIPAVPESIGQFDE